MQLTQLNLTLHNVSPTIKPIPANLLAVSTATNLPTDWLTGKATDTSDAAAAGPAPTSSAAAATPAPAKAAATPAASSSKGDQATQDFLDYMKETPAQRLEDSWLAAHHLTRKDLEAMSPDQRKAIEKQMATDIEQQIKEAAKSKRRTDIIV